MDRENKNDGETCRGGSIYFESFLTVGGVIVLSEAFNYVFTYYEPFARYFK